MKPINRNLLKISVILLIAGFLLALVSIFTDNYSSPVGYAGFAALLAGLVMNNLFSRCPHCGRFVQGISPFSESAGICPKCKGKMEFDS